MSGSDENSKRSIQCVYDVPPFQGTSVNRKKNVDPVCSWIKRFIHSERNTICILLTIDSLFQSRTILWIYYTLLPVYTLKCTPFVAITIYSGTGMWKYHDLDTQKSPFSWKNKWWMVAVRPRGWFFFTDNTFGFQ